jgi:phage tail-like protein
MSRDRSDWLLAQLPGGMLDDEFLVRFLRIFQDGGQTYLDQIDTLEHIFDPAVTPTPMIRILGEWIGLDYLDAELPDDVQRRLVRKYGALIAWRGTRKGMADLLEAITGSPAEVTDFGGVFAADDPRDDFRSHVAITVADSGWATDDDLLRIVQRELPATVTFELRRGDRTLWPLISEGAA